MRVLASADLHGRRQVYEWLLKIAREQSVDALILAGDLLGCLDGFNTPEDAQRHEASALVQLLEMSPAPVLYIMGNDDLIALDSRSPGVQSIHGRRVSIGPFNFVGYQYSLPFMGGVHEKPDDAIEIDLMELGPLVDSRTVLVTHSPVLGTLDPGFNDSRIGSASLLRFVDRHPPLAHIHGHSHAGFGRAGKHMNVASAGRPRAMIVDLDTMQHQVLGG